MALTETGLTVFTLTDETGLRRISSGLLENGIVVFGAAAAPTLPAGNQSLVVTAPATVTVPVRDLAAGNQSITLTAGAVVVVSGAVTVPAGAQSVVITAPDTTTGGTLIAAASVLTVTAPAPVIASVSTVIATASVVTVSAPTAGAIVPITFVAGPAVIIVIAPAFEPTGQGGLVFTSRSGRRQSFACTSGLTAARRHVYKVRRASRTVRA